jgi:hypothetical protein
MKIELLQEFVIKSKDRLIEFFLTGQCSVQSPPHVGMEIRIPDDINDVEGKVWHLNHEDGMQVQSVQMVAIKKGIYIHSARLVTAEISDYDDLVYFGHNFFDSCLDDTVNWSHNDTVAHFTNFLLNHGAANVLNPFHPADDFFQSLLLLLDPTRSE